MRGRSRAGLGAGFAALLLALSSSGAEAANADCRRIGSPVERAVCADPALAALDKALAEALRERLASPRTREAVLADQRRWLSARALACPAPAPGIEARSARQSARCLARIYAQRIASLTREANEARWAKVPFRPVLREGAGQALCESFLRDVTAGFLGPAPRVNPLGEREIGFRSIALGRALAGDEEPPAIAVADPYNSGRDSTVLRLETAPTRRAATWSYRVFPSEDAMRRAFRVAPTGAPNPFAIDGDRDLSRPLVDAAHFAGRPADLPAPRPDLDEPAPRIEAAPRLFREGGRTLALIPSRVDGERATYLGIYALASPTQVERLCLVESEREPAPDEQLVALPEIETLSQAANAVLPPPFCGPPTIDEATLDTRAVTRPWTLRPLPSGGAMPRAAGTEELRLFLRRKALTGLEARRNVDALTLAHAEAEARIATFYRDVFGRDEVQARALARLYLDRKLGSGLAVEEEGAIKPFLAPDFEARRAPHGAALAGDAAALWSRLGSNPKAAIAAARGDVDEPLLSLALEHPDLVRGLLARGADPNAYGASGFTPLMAAARLGLVEAARLLLEGGADPDLLSRPARFEPRVLDAQPCEAAGDPAAEAGLTALVLAQVAGASEVADLLEPRTVARSAPR